MDTPVPVFFPGPGPATVPLYYQPPPFPVAVPPAGFVPGYGGFGYQPQLPMQPLMPVLPGYNWPIEHQFQFQQPFIPMADAPQTGIPPLIIGKDSGYGPNSTEHLLQIKYMRQPAGTLPRGPHVRPRKSRPNGNGCAYCLASGESAHVWKSHVLREDGKVTCPILRVYVCPNCGAEGDNAHTISYCPNNENKTKSYVPLRHGHNAAGKDISTVRRTR